MAKSISSARLRSKARSASRQIRQSETRLKREMRKIERNAKKRY